MATDEPVQVSKTAKTQNKAMIKAALTLAKATKAKYFFVYIDAVEDDLFPEELPKGLHLILVTKKNVGWNGKTPVKAVVPLPNLKLGRLGLVKIATIFAISSKLVSPEDMIVFLAGKAEQGILDMLMAMQIGNESEMLTGTDFAEIPDTIKPTVFEHALKLAIELSTKGREGKPVGTIFVLGDEEKVMQLSKQMIINPFKGYEQDERNLLNPALRDTLFEFAALDGAFIISGDGEVIAAGRYLGAAIDESDIPRGLGARHIAAAGITALTNAITIVISESTGDVRIFRKGKVIMSFDKPPR
ncbi:MAG TPA: hypothetical protein DDW49_05750 [Deltaproteobacteria bacterium]|nr:MAG: hypothetical protein A2048_09790 [Deltaproteobacteria bacterium GWA2_45_12]HBF12877.1 hypothetical protein [Deltaproteobacteria bacterium]